MKLIPSTPRPTGSYWCSWRTQRLMVSGPIIMSKFHDRSYYRKELCKTLNDAWLFDDPGLLSKFMHNIRGDVYALLDDGWDIPYIDENGNKDHEQIGSCIPNPERFPMEILLPKGSELYPTRSRSWDMQGLVCGYLIRLILRKRTIFSLLTNSTIIGQSARAGSPTPTSNTSRSTGDTTTPTVASISMSQERL